MNLILLNPAFLCIHSSNVFVFFTYFDLTSQFMPDSDFLNERNTMVPSAVFGDCKQHFLVLNKYICKYFVIYMCILCFLYLNKHLLSLYIYCSFIFSSLGNKIFSKRTDNVESIARMHVIFDESICKLPKCKCLECMAFSSDCIKPDTLICKAFLVCFSFMHIVNDRLLQTNSFVMKKNEGMTL